MSIRFDCPSCSKAIVTTDRFQGRQVRCPACDIALTVPKKGSTEREDNRQTDAVVPTLVPGPLPFPPINPMVPSEPRTGLEENFDEATPKPDTAKRPPRSIKGEKHEKGEEDLEWDITPMVDVAFLLLIFFMLTASFSIQKGIRTKPPQSDEASSNPQSVVEDPAEKMIIQVDEFSAYTIISPNGGTQDASSRQELVVVLKDLRLLYEDQPPNIIIQAHEDSKHGAVVACMDAAREADFAKFQMSIVEEFD